MVSMVIDFQTSLFVGCQFVPLISDDSGIDGIVAPFFPTAGFCKPGRNTTMDCRTREWLDIVRKLPNASYPSGPPTTRRSLRVSALHEAQRSTAGASTLL